MPPARYLVGNIGSVPRSSILFYREFPEIHCNQYAHDSLRNESRLSINSKQVLRQSIKIPRKKIDYEKSQHEVLMILLLPQGY